MLTVFVVVLFSFCGIFLLVLGVSLLLLLCVFCVFCLFVLFGF